MLRSSETGSAGASSLACVGGVLIVNFVNSAEANCGPLSETTMSGALYLENIPFSSPRCHRVETVNFYVVAVVVTHDNKPSSMEFT